MLKETIHRTSQVIHVLNQYLEEAGTDSPAGRLASAKLLEFHRQHREAIETYSSVEEREAAAGEARARLALALIKSGRPEQALNAAQELAKQNPGFTFKSLLLEVPVSAYTVLGDAQAASGRQKEALESYQKALELQGDDSHSAAMATRISLDLKDLEGAARFSSMLSEGQGYDELIAAVKLMQSGGDLPAIDQLSASMVQDHAV